MVTTFTSRELVRDALVTLFTANNSWQNVYGYFPSGKEAVGKTPLLIITSAGTSQDMAGVWTNPTAYRFKFESYTLADRDSDSWDSSAAEDKLDALDAALRQVIRNNAGSMATCDQLRFEEGFSTRDDVNIGGTPYIRETRYIIADLVNGTMA